MFRTGSLYIRIRRVCLQAGPRSWFAIAVCLSIVSPAVGARAQSACPLSTQVYPFAASTAGHYEIRVTDGGPGDLDGAPDGDCQIDLSVCLGVGDGCQQDATDRVAVDVLGTAPWRQEAAVKLAD